MKAIADGHERRGLARRLWRRKPIVAGVVAVVAGSALIAAAPAVAAPDQEPRARCADAGATYERAAAEDVGLDAAKLREALDYWTRHGSETIKVFRHNCLVGEGALDNAFDRVPLWLRSHAKTFHSLIIGRAQTLGYLDIDEPIGKYIPEDLGDAEHRAITFRQLLTMRSGLHMNWTREANQAVSNRIREALSLKFDHAPGTYFEYAQTPMYLLPFAAGHAVQQATGMSYEQFAQAEFFGPLGIPESHYAWGRDRTGNIDGPGWNTFGLPIDFGRIGQLLLNEGSFGGRQLIDPTYLAEATTGTKQNPGYGMPFWLNSADRFVNASIFERRELDGPIVASAPRDMYMTWGYHGQHTFVIPSLDMIVTRTGNMNPDMIGTSDPGNAVIAGVQKETYYEGFRLLLAAVQDVDMPAPPPYSTQPTLDLDPMSFVNPTDNLAAAGTGPAAPEGCTAVGCDGRPVAEGKVEMGRDVAEMLPGAAGRMSNE